MENINKDKFKVGDFVIIKQDNSEQTTLGKIEEIFEEIGGLKFKYNEYYFPEKTNGKNIYIIIHYRKLKEINHF
jgi:hypothetical protein